MFAPSAWENLTIEKNGDFIVCLKSIKEKKSEVTYAVKYFCQRDNQSMHLFYCHVMCLLQVHTSFEMHFSQK